MLAGVIGHRVELVFLGKFCLFLVCDTLTPPNLDKKICISQRVTLCFSCSGSAPDSDVGGASRLGRSSIELATVLLSFAPSKSSTASRW
jgi:hypothetical protein